MYLIIFICILLTLIHHISNSIFLLDVEIDLKLPEYSFLLEEVVKAFLLCHDTKTKFKKRSNTPIHLTVKKDHECALNFCRDIGLDFSGNVKITQQKINSYKVKAFADFNEFYPIISVNEYTATRNRFSILVGEKFMNELNEESKFTLYVWSNELASVIDLLRLDYFLKEKLKEVSQKLKEKGFQMMYYCKKELDFYEKNNFLLKKDSIKSGINLNQLELDAFYNEIEKDLDYVIGATYSYILKPYVIETLSDFQAANMKMFLISGDSEDKTMAVAYASKFVQQGHLLKRLISDDNTKLFIMMKYIFNTFKKETDENENGFADYNNQFGKIRKNIQKKSIVDFQLKNKFTLIVDGKTLEVIFQNRYLANHFKFLLLLCSQFIGFNTNQFVNRNLILMVKKLYGKQTNETILAIGYGESFMMQEADISIEIENSNKKNGCCDIEVSDFKNLTNIVLIWSKISFENILNNLYSLGYIACFLTYLRFISSFFSYFSHNEIIPTVIYVLIYKNFLLLSLYSQIFIEKRINFAILKRFPILYREKNWKKNYEIKSLVWETVVPSLSLALLFNISVFFQRINFQNFLLKTLPEIQIDTYLVCHFLFFAKVNEFFKFFYVFGLYLIFLTFLHRFSQKI